MIDLLKPRQPSGKQCEDKNKHKSDGKRCSISPIFQYFLPLYTMKAKGETCNAISLKVPQNNFWPLIIDCPATIDSPSFKDANKTDINRGECSMALNPMSSITLWIV